MPADPSAADPLVSPVRELFALIEAAILAVMARALAGGWSATRIQLAVTVALRPFPAMVSQAVTDAVLGADLLGAAAAVDDLPDVDRPAPREKPSPRPLLRLLDGALRQTPRNTARTTVQLNQQVTKAMTAGKYGTRREAAADLLSKYARHGVTRFVDSAGKNWDLVSYAEMVTRTTTSRTLSTAYLQQTLDGGRTLILVSDAPEECERCRPFEGKVLSIGPDPGAGRHMIDGVAVTVMCTVAFAEDAGLHHPNCRHRYLAFFPGVTSRPTVTRDPEGAKLRTEQRARERRIRALKREAEAARLAGGPKDPAAKAANAKVRAANAEFKVWREQHGRKNLAYRTSLTLR